jgi:hypothetical protein
MNLRWSLVPVSLLAAACGGKSKPPPPPAPVVEAKPTPPPPPPPVCVPAVEPAVLGTPTSDGKTAQFCAGDGGEQSQCFAVDLSDGKFTKLAEAPTAQPAALEPGTATVETTATDVKVCVAIEGTADAACTTLRPKVPRGASEPLRAAINPSGTTMVVALGEAARGKGFLEVWDVAKKKKTATIKYTKGDYKCADVAMLGDTIFVNANVCAGPDARGALYSAKGKKLADVGSKDFGTYGATAIQVAGSTWAFLESGAGAVVLQDVATGAVGKTIDLVGLWAGDDASDGALASGNPGESTLVRGGEGQLVVIAGSPRVGNVGVIAADVGEVQVWKALPCAAPAAAAPADAPADAPAEN